MAVSAYSTEALCSAWPGQRETRGRSHGEDVTCVRQIGRDRTRVGLPYGSAGREPAWPLHFLQAVTQKRRPTMAGRRWGRGCRRLARQPRANEGGQWHKAGHKVECPRFGQAGRAPLVPTRAVCTAFQNIASGVPDGSQFLPAGRSLRPLSGYGRNPGMG
jgi:hypothetical protein